MHLDLTSNPKLKNDYAISFPFWTKKMGCLSNQEVSETAYRIKLIIWDSLNGSLADVDCKLYMAEQD